MDYIMPRKRRKFDKDLKAEGRYTPIDTTAQSLIKPAVKQSIFPITGMKHGQSVYGSFTHFQN